MFGGKDPETNQREAKAKMPPLFGAPKSEEAGETPDVQKTEGEGKAISPEEAMFHGDAQSCSTCGNFNATGEGGAGECTKGVDVSYAENDPSTSWCKYYEAGQVQDTPPDASKTVAPVPEIPVVA